MKTFTVLFTILLLTFAALHLPAQRNGLGSNNWANLPRDGSVWAFNGQYAAGWQQPMRNMVRHSEDISSSLWNYAGAFTADSSTSLLETASTNQHESYQGFPVTIGVTYIFKCDVKYRGRQWLRFRADAAGQTNRTAWFDLQNGVWGTIGSALTVSAIALDGSSALGAGSYGLTISTTGVSTGTGYFDFFLTTSDGGTGSYLGDVTKGLYITKMQVSPGSLPLSYQRTGSGQTITDLASALHLTLGSNSTATDTNDPTVSVWSRNLFPAGSADNLQSGWTATGSPAATIVDSDTVTFSTDATSRVTSGSLSLSANIPYVIKATVWCDSGTQSIRAIYTDSVLSRLTSSNIPVTTTPTVVTYSFTPANASSAPGFSNASDAQTRTVNITNLQVEVGTTATAFTSPAHESRAVGLLFDGVDDYVNGASLPLPGDWTFLAVLRPTAVSKGLWRNGTSSPNVSLDANSKVAFAGASTITATNAVPQQMWSVVGITVSGTTVTHYLNGKPNGSGTSASGNAFTALRVGYDGTAYYAGQYALIGADPYAWTPWMMAQYTRNIAEQFCPQRGVLCALKQSMESSGIWWREKEWASIFLPPFMARPDPLASFAGGRIQ